MPPDPDAAAGEPVDAPDVPVQDPDGVPVEVAGRDGPADGAGDGKGQDPGAGGPDPSADGGTGQPGPDGAGHQGGLEQLLESERQRASRYQEELKRALADCENISKRVRQDVENGINARLGGLMVDLLAIYDDFERAREAVAKGGADTAGLDSVLRNMDSLLSKYGVSPIDSLGQIFDPNLHEAVSVTEDPDLDESTVTREIRKGYISQVGVIRPALVEISKKG